MNLQIQLEIETTSNKKLKALKNTERPLAKCKTLTVFNLAHLRFQYDKTNNVNICKQYEC